MQVIQTGFIKLSKCVPVINILQRKMLKVTPFLTLALFVSTGLAQAKSETPTKTEKNRGTLINRLEAAVNSDPILSSDISNFRKNAPLRAQLDPLFAGTPLASQLGSVTDEQVVEFLIRERLILQEFPISDQEVEKEINSIQNKNNRMTRSQLVAQLAAESFDFKSYFELVRSGISKRYLIDRDIRSRITPSDDDVKNYFYNNYMRGKAIPRSLELQLISISTVDYKNPSDAYDAALRAKKALDSGEDFDIVAKRFNSDNSEGRLGALAEDKIHPSIRDEAIKLSIGRYSDIFGGPQISRYFILKLVDVRSAEFERLKELENDIRNKLTADAFQHQIDLWVERKKQSSFIHRQGTPVVKEVPVMQ